MNVKIAGITMTDQRASDPNCPLCHGTGQRMGGCHGWTPEPCWCVTLPRVEEQRPSNPLRHALIEIRNRLHAAGRRPEECYEMSLIDDALAADETPAARKDRLICAAVDAARYRWLRTRVGVNRNGPWLACGNTKVDPRETDAGIDAAMQADVATAVTPK